MKRVCFLLLATILFGSPWAVAESKNPYEIHGGFSFLGIENGDHLEGWDGGFTYYFTDHFGLTSDFSGHYNHWLDYYNFLFGPQYAIGRNGPVTFFLHSLVGVGHQRVSCFFPNQTFPHTRTQAAFALGGGLDVRLCRSLILRPIQLEWIHQFGDSRINQARYTIGFVFRF